MDHLAVVEDPPNDPLEQDQRMRAVLVDMQLLMYGNVSRFDQNSGRQKPSGGHCPPGESQPLHTIWQQAYVLAKPEAREQVIADATDALVKYRCGPRVDVDGEAPEQWRARLLKDGEGADPRWVAVQFATSTKLVCKLRVDDERDPSTGRKLPGARSVTERAKQLAADGFTARQIAYLTGLKPGTAQYHVNRARKAA